MDQEVEELIETYLKEVVLPTFPNARTGQTGYTTSNNQLPSEVSIKSHVQQYTYEGTPFYYENHKDTFVHYTRLANMYEILKSKELRMSDFKNFSDPQELYYLNNIYPELTSNNQRKLLVDSTKCFALSFNRSSAKEDFSMWRLYGDDGIGASFEFEFLGEKKQRDAWYGYYLSNVFYSDNKHKILQDFFRRHKAFEEKGRFAKIEDHESFILPVVALLKRQIYKVEKEIRLVHIENGFFKDNYQNKIVGASINLRGEFHRFVKIPFSTKIQYEDNLNRSEKDILQTRINIYSPHLLLKSITIGYRHDEKSFSQVVSNFYKLIKFYDFPISPEFHIKHSNLRKYFEK